MDILKTNGTILASVADGTVNTTASPLALPGRNTAGYGQNLNQNLVKLLENFADITAPSNSILGQLWFNTDTNELSLKTAQGFKPISIAHKTSITPSNPNIGEMWWDNSAGQLKVWNGGHWALVGPGYQYGWGETGLFSEIVRDTNGIDHFVIKIKIANETRLIISQDVEFVPNTSITGFTSIKPGINVTRYLPNFRIRATAEDSDKLGGMEASRYVRNDQDADIAGQITAESLSVGNSSVTVVDLGAEKNLTISNTEANSYINFQVNVDGVQATVLSLSPTGEVLVSRTPTNARAVADKAYVDQLRTDINDTIYDANSGLLGYLNSNVAMLTDRINAAVTDIENNANDIVDLSGALASKANIVSPSLQGTPTAPTPAIGTDNTVIATTEFVNASDDLVKSYVDSSIAALQTGLNGSVADLLALKANINSPVLTGVPQAPTAASNADSLQIANTRWTRDLVQSSDAYWQGSRRFISTNDPTASDGRDGDFWFKYQ